MVYRRRMDLRVTFAAALLVLLTACGSEGDTGAEGLPATAQEASIASIDPTSEIPRVPEQDINLVCADGDGYVEITNSASTARHFHLTFYFSDDQGVRVDQGFAHPYDVGPGETVRADVHPIDTESWASCRVARALAIPADTAAAGDAWWPLP